MAKLSAKQRVAIRNELFTLTRDQLTDRCVDYMLRHPKEFHAWYEEFCIKKPNGKLRNISAPDDELKLIQKALLREWGKDLDEWRQYMDVGFRPKRNIQAAAAVLGLYVDLRDALVINVDLKDFFPSICRERVYAIWRQIGATKQEADHLTMISCHHKKLAQGSPLSPVLASIACRELDSQITNLVKKHRGSYTRYADDLTIAVPARGLTAKQQKELAQMLIDDVKRKIQGQGLRVAQNKIKVSTTNRPTFEIVGGVFVRSKGILRAKRVIRNKVRMWAFNLNKLIAEAMKLGKNPKEVAKATTLGNSTYFVALGNLAYATSYKSFKHLAWERTTGYYGPNRSLYNTELKERWQLV